MHYQCTTIASLDQNLLRKHKFHLCFSDNDDTVNKQGHWCKWPTLNKGHHAQFSEEFDGNPGHSNRPLFVT